MSKHSLFFYADECICQLDTLIIEIEFLRYVMTFDKKERKIHLIDYTYYNVKETKVSCLHQNEVVAHSFYVQIFLRSQQLTSGISFLLKHKLF